jgi:glycosyltransferase involved in cell wall biosynthesis
MNKILHIIVGLNSGGAELMLSRLVAGSPKVKHIIVSLTSVGVVGDGLMKDGITVIALKINAFNFLYKFINLVKLINKEKPDVVQTWMYHSDLIGGIAAKIAGVKNIVWNIRNTEIPQKGLSRTGFIIRICAVLSAFIPNKIICCAYSALNKHYELGYSRAKMIVIPNGYSKTYGGSANKRNEIRSWLGFAGDVLLIGTVGRYDYLKGYDLLISSASIFSEHYKGKFAFICVGKGVDEQNLELMEILSSVDLQKRFILMGERSNLEAIYSAMDFYCLSSRSEGFPNVVAEAMLCGLPCVVTDVGDASRMVDYTGIVVDPDNVQSLALGLLQMANFSFENRKTLGDLARRRILENYEMNEIVNQYFSVYNLEGVDKS